MQDAFSLAVVVGTGAGWTPLGGKSRTEPTHTIASAGRPAVMTGPSPGTIPTSNDVSHYDPAKSHHRAWLQALDGGAYRHAPGKSWVVVADAIL